MKHRALFALGMHRSGTSAITGVLSCLGVVLGKRLYKPQTGVNERGFWEHADIADTHDSIFRVIGSYWDDILPLKDDWVRDPKLARFKTELASYVTRDLSGSGLWGLKDPRVCRLLPLWLEILKAQNTEPAFVFIVRPPSQVSRSLQKRDGMSHRKAILLWLRHNLEAEFWSQRDARVFVTFDDLISKTEVTLRNIEQVLKLRFPRSIEEALPDIRSFLSADLRHHDDKESPEDERLDSLAQDTFALFAAGEMDAPAFGAQAARLRDRLAEYTECMDPVLVEQLAYLGRERGRFEQMFSEIYHSTSWKVTWPLRALERALKNGVPCSY